MAYYKSTDVLAFPTTYRIYNVGGKYTSELNITNMLKAFIAGKSFVIDESKAPSSYTPTSLKVVINGYYFEIAFSAFPESKVPANLYLGIKVDASGYLVNIGDSSVNLDVNSDFTALAGNINSAPSGCTSTLKVTDNSGNLVNTSYIPSIADENGNWYDFSKLIKLIIIKDGKAYIDPTYIDKSIAAYFPLFTVGAAEKLVYNVTVNPTTGAVSSTPYNIGGKGLTQTYVYFSGGKPVAGNRTTISSSQPSSYTGVQQGDLWFVLKG